MCCSGHVHGIRVEFDLEVVSITSILLVLSSAAIILGSVLAIAQTNIKRMLAYSSVGQIGYIVLGASIVNETAMTGSLVHILNHALMKGTLFFIAGCVLYGRHEDIAFCADGTENAFCMAAFYGRGSPCGRAAHRGL
jgi:multicomponent Na+:H+ antiporter subunit D